MFFGIHFGMMMMMMNMIMILVTVLVIIRNGDNGNNDDMMMLMITMIILHLKSVVTRSPGAHSLFQDVAIEEHDYKFPSGFKVTVV